MDKKSVLIIGSGAREHALGWKIKQSKYVSKIYFAPGNGGTSAIGQNINISPEDNVKLLNWANKKRIYLTIVGPEVPLEAGIVDLFKKNRLLIFGPSKKAAQLETSKAFASEFMKKYKIPHPASQIFISSSKAKEFIRSNPNKQFVIKADGLAAGKGVIVSKDGDEACDAIEKIMVKKIFGKAGDKIVIQEKVTGYEVSVTVISDGNKYLLLPYSEDHKQLLDHDLGPNTGGMGVVAPHPLANDKLSKQFEDQIVKPTINGMLEEGIPYAGVLYPGIMITKKGPMVLEYNSRFGDPETEALLPLLDSRVDFFEVLENSALENLKLEGKYPFKNGCCVVVTLASMGYPQKYETGKKIYGLTNGKDDKGLIIFHAASIKKKDKYLTSGGRVLMVAALGKSVSEARQKVYNAIGNKIHFDKMHFRKDIGRRRR